MGFTVEVHWLHEPNILSVPLWLPRSSIRYKIKLAKDDLCRRGIIDAAFLGRDTIVLMELNVCLREGSKKYVSLKSHSAYYLAGNGPGIRPSLESRGDNCRMGRIKIVTMSKVGLERNWGASIPVAQQMSSPRRICGRCSNSLLHSYLFACIPSPLTIGRFIG